MSKHYDVIVAGAGSMGMAAGYYLQKQGLNVLLIDAHEPPHDQGSHAGETRIIRHAYGEGREYVPLALRSQELWEELERKSHRKIFTQAGAMGFGPKGDSPFIDEAMASGKEYNLDIEYLNGKEMKERFPGLTLPDDYIGFYETNSGFLFSENSIATYRDLAVHHGADLSFNNPVTAIDATNDKVTVTTENGQFTGEQLIIAAGAWSGYLAKQVGLNLPLKPTRQPVAWFEANEELFDVTAFPTFMVEVPSEDERAIYYGFPTFDGCGLKIGRHDFEQKIDPHTLDRQFGSEANDEGHLRELLDKFMPEASGKLIKGTICMYTRTPDGHFIIDKHPKHSHIHIAAGFSGHGYKFASVVGEILSQLVVSGETEHDISSFALERFRNYTIDKEKSTT